MRVETPLDKPTLRESLRNIVDAFKIAFGFRPYSVRTPLRLLKVTSALLMADNEQELLSAVSLGTDDEVCLRLFYLEKDDVDPTNSVVRGAASWQGGAVWNEDPAFGQPVRLSDYPILAEFGKLDDPVILLRDVSAVQEKLPSSRLFPGVQAAALIKLYTPSDKQQWQAVICFTWQTTRRFTNDEEYLYRGISQTASTVVSGYLLHRQALANVERLQEVDRLKTEFLYSMSHELRTPLVGIITGADIVLHGAAGEINPRVRDNTQIILDTGLHLLALINEILDMAKIEAGSLELALESLDIRALLSEAVETVQPTADKKGLTLTVTLPLVLPSVVADRTRILQVILNLLSNAIKFTPQGAICLSACLAGDELVVAMKDEGIGIQPEDATLIFEPFRQVDGSLQRSAGGTGLGLPISKRIVQLHGGDIWLDSTPGQGSTFYFSLPVAEQR